MTRQPVEVAGVVLPASYRTDTSVERDFLTNDEPSTVGCTLAVGDKWYQAGTPTPPPPPPTTITPFVVGQDKPSSRTGGLGPRISTVTKTVTDMAGVVAGQVVRGWHVTGFPTFVAGAYYVDCTFTANDTSHTFKRFAALESRNQQPTTYFVNCEFVGDPSFVWASAIGTHDVVILHCDLQGVDGGSAGYSAPANTNYIIHACRTRLRPFFPDSSHQNGWSHADGIEIRGGANTGGVGTEFVATSLQGGTTPTTATGDPYLLGKLSSLMIQMAFAANPTVNITFDSCWFDTWVNVDQLSTKDSTGALLYITGHINDSWWQYPSQYHPNGYKSSEINFSVDNNNQFTQSGNQRWLGGTWGPIRLTGAKK